MHSLSSCSQEVYFNNNHNVVLQMAAKLMWHALSVLFFPCLDVHVCEWGPGEVRDRGDRMLAYFGLPNFKGMPKLYVAIRR